MRTAKKVIDMYVQYRYINDIGYWDKPLKEQDYKYCLNIRTIFVAFWGLFFNLRIFIKF